LIRITFYSVFFRLSNGQESNRPEDFQLRRLCSVHRVRPNRTRFVIGFGTNRTDI
jgi:hypothetical protein